MAADSVAVLARAKVNLCLHVTGRRADGYHLLDSLVAFPELGDVLTARRAPEGLTLTTGGPFGAAVGPLGDNLVLRAARAMADAHPGQGARLHLDKALPVAAGLGGGSADAAATILALERLWGVAGPDRAAMALALGADVPVCLAGQPARMQGIGEVLSPAPALPDCALVMVNAGLPVPTGPVFKALEGLGAPMPGLPEGFGSVETLAAWLVLQRNDLETPARRVAPVIGTVLAALSGLGEVLVARMSGSGGTCFGLCAGEDAAEAAARKLRKAFPHWWVAAAPLRAWRPAEGQTTRATT